MISIKYFSTFKKRTGLSKRLSTSSFILHWQPLVYKHHQNFSLMFKILHRCLFLWDPLSENKLKPRLGPFHSKMIHFFVPFFLFPSFFFWKMIFLVFRFHQEGLCHSWIANGSYYCYNSLVCISVRTFSSYFFIYFQQILQFFLKKNPDSSKV